MKKRLAFLLIAVLVAATAFSASALTLNPFKRAGRVKHQNLIIGGNYTNARILIDLAQYYTKQPAMLICSEADGSSKIYYVPAEDRATKPVEAKDFRDMVDYINPDRVIILGGKDEVSTKFVEEIRDRYQVLILDSTNWSNNAAALADMLGVVRIRTDFERQMRELYRYEESKRSRR